MGFLDFLRVGFCLLGVDSLPVISSASVCVGGGGHEVDDDGPVSGLQTGEAADEDPGKQSSKPE